jgi:hypothetical protein
MTQWSTQSITEMSDRNFPGGKGQSARNTENLTAICEPFSREFGSLDFSQTYGPSRPITGIALLLPSTPFILSV